MIILQHNIPSHIGPGPSKRQEVLPRGRRREVSSSHFLCARQRWYRHHRQDDQGRLTNWPSSSHVQISPDPQIMSHKYKYKTIFSPIDHCNLASKYPRLHKRMSYRYKNTRQIQKGRNIVSPIDRCHRTSKYRRPSLSPQNNISPFLSAASLSTTRRGPIPIWPSSCKQSTWRWNNKFINIANNRF